MLYKEESMVIEQKPTILPCPFGGHSYLELRDENGKRQGCCMMAKQLNPVSYITANSSKLKKAGCPRPDISALSPIYDGDNYCKFRDGTWKNI